MPNFKNTIEIVKSSKNRERIAADTDRYVIYNGKLKDIIKARIQKEFLLKDTIEDLIGRIVPINITAKIIDKLSMVYREPALRSAVDDNETDNDALEFYTRTMEVNKKMKHANRYFNLHKHTLLEPFLTKEGIPMMRVLPSQTYTPLSDDKIQPERPTMIVKHISFNSENPEQERHAIWTDDNHWVVNGNGDVVQSEMIAMDNPEGVNPFGVIPFTYINSSEDLIVPISNDDLVNVQIAINLLLTDLLFASKYQAWSIIAIIGGKDDNLPLNPNSVINLPFGPQGERPAIETVKPDLDSDEMLRLIEAMVSMLLTTNNLSVGTVSGKLSVDNSASGVAKLIDRSELTEERMDSIQFFRRAEQEFWDKLAHKIMPVWIKSGDIKVEFAKKFSDKFLLQIRYPELTPPMGIKERIEIAEGKLKLGLITKKAVLKEIDPNLSSDEIEQILRDLKEEALERFNLISEPTIEQ